MVYHCGITCPISPAGSTGQEFSDEQTFSYCNSLSYIHVPASRRLVGPKHAEYRYTGGYHACTGNYHNHAGARYATGSCARLDDQVESGTVPSRYRSSVPKEYQQYVPFAK
jgi:hypothetical protein